MFILAACAAAFACAKAVGPAQLEDAVFVDTESSTNMPPPVCTGAPHVFSFTMDFARSHTNLVDFQAELFNDGSYDYRYADRTEHFAASLPFDLDGDGLENSVDPDPRVSAIEQEMSNMPQKLSGAGWKTMFWGNDLAKAIMALDDRGERIRLIDRYLDSMLELEPSLTVKDCYTLAFRNYEELIGTCTIFEGEPEIAERILGIMCDCIRLHRQEVKKWADAIESEPNRRNRVPLKNIYRGLSSDFMMFTNHIERTYFPWMKAHGLSMERHEHWRRKINTAYGLEATDGEVRRHTGKTGEE